MQIYVSGLFLLERLKDKFAVKIPSCLFFRYVSFSVASFGAIFPGRLLARKLVWNEFYLTLNFTGGRKKIIDRPRRKSGVKYTISEPRGFYGYPIRALTIFRREILIARNHVLGYKSPWPTIYELML